MSFVFKIGSTAFSLTMISFINFKFFWSKSDNFKFLVSAKSSKTLEFLKILSVSLDKIDICSVLEPILSEGRFVALSQKRIPLTSFKT